MKEVDAVTNRQAEAVIELIKILAKAQTADEFQNSLTKIQEVIEKGATEPSKEDSA